MVTANKLAAGGNRNDPAARKSGHVQEDASRFTFRPHRVFRVGCDGCSQRLGGRAAGHTIQEAGAETNQRARQGGSSWGGNVLVGAKLPSAAVRAGVGVEVGIGRIGGEAGVDRRAGRGW